MAWSRQLGTNKDDVPVGIAVDRSGNTFVGGATNGNLGGPNAGEMDVFLTKLSVTGAVLWSKQIGTSRDEAGEDVAVDAAGNALVVGETLGSLSGPSSGANDIFVSKFDANGNLLWSKQFGSKGNDFAGGITLDAAGKIYIGGYTDGALGGPNAGLNDAFMAILDADGNLIALNQLGSAGTDFVLACAVDDAGNPLIAGFTDGNIDGINAGDRDAFLIKFAPVPEPNCIVIVAIATLMLRPGRRAARRSKNN